LALEVFDRRSDPLDRGDDLLGAVFHFRGRRAELNGNAIVGHCWLLLFVSSLSVTGFDKRLFVTPIVLRGRSVVLWERGHLGSVAAFCGRGGRILRGSILHGAGTTFRERFRENSRGLARNYKESCG